METTALVGVRDQLLDRRQKLETVAATIGQSADVTRLLREVDAALARMNAGVFGICETCHDPIESEQLLADPLTRFCLDHLSPVEQRALQYDLDLAARIQRELLPRPDSRIDGWDVAYHYQPARAVSGDYCDLITDGDRVFFLVGDIAGKGVAAAMLMSHLSAMLRTLIPLGLPLGEIMERANRAFCESTLAAHYATLVCGRASASGEVEICNAGHPPPILLQPGGSVRIDATGLPIGMFCTERFASRTVRLAPGDALLLYTDGLVEAQDPAGMEYGIDRLAALASAESGSSQALVDACVADLAAFRGAPGAEDDLTIFAIGRRR